MSYSTWVLENVLLSKDIVYYVSKHTSPFYMITFLVCLFSSQFSLVVQCYNQTKLFTVIMTYTVWPFCSYVITLFWVLKKMWCDWLNIYIVLLLSWLNLWSLTSVIIKLCQNGFDTVFTAGGSLLHFHRQAGQSRTEENRLRRHFVDFGKQLQKREF